MDTLLALLRTHASELETTYRLILDGATWRMDTGGIREADLEDWPADVCTIVLSHDALERLLKEPTKATVFALALRKKLRATPVGPAVRLAEQILAWKA
jgi:hypothetical protein